VALKIDNESEWKDLVTDVDAFYNEETDPDVQGKVLSITQMTLAGRDTMVAVLKLTAPCTAVKGSGDKKEEIELPVGGVIGVVVKHKLADLPSFVDNQVEAIISAKKKIQVGQGNTMWTYAVRFRGRRTGFATAGAKNQERQGDGGPSTKSKGDELEQF
jgi:hypothetical protein